MPEPLHMPLTDATARQDALDVNLSFIVEAPAGSGKTGLLIQRFLRLLAEGGVERPEEVLAITFTRKATGEMRERLLEALRDADRNSAESAMRPFDRDTRRLAQNVMARDAALGWNLLDQPQRLNIRTIDSLCHEIAGYLPILSGLGGRLEPVDDARSLYAAAAQQTLEELASDDTAVADALHILLLHRDGRLNDCEDLIAKMLGQRDQWARLIPAGDDLTDEYLDGVLRPRMEAEFAGIVVTALERVRDLLSPGELSELAMLGHVAAVTLAADGKEASLAQCLQTADPPKAEAECAEHWHTLSRFLLTDGKWRKTINVSMGFPAKSAEKQRLLALIDRVNTNDLLLEALNALSTLPPARYTDEEWRVTKALFRLLRRAHAQLRIVFAASGQCDFSELSMAALEALETPGGSTELAAALGLKFRHLLVDEMQDTSISQYKLLEMLTQGWDGASQTVFLVGDPRQSIYLFRQARVEQFWMALHGNKLGDIRLRHLQLTANFRSHPALVAAFNEHFTAIRPHQVHAGDDSPHLPAQAGRSNEGEASGVRLHWHANTLPSGSGTADKDQAAEAEAAEIAQIIHLATTGVQLQPGERSPIAVLVRAKNHAARIAAALRHAQISYRATEIDALGSQQEVLDALSLLRALLHPADRVAWLAVLHTPWCGLGVRDLHIVAGSDDSVLAKRCIDELLAERVSLLSPEGRVRALHVQQILHSAITQQGRQPIAHWLESAWYSLGAPLYLAPHERQNVSAFFALVAACEGRGETIDAALLLERLEDLCAPESEAPALVDIMTIHKAKGLEWKIVIVPALHRQGSRDTAPLLQYMKDVMQEEKPPLFAPIPRAGTSEQSLHKYLSGLRTQAQRLELRRLFYVAATRAREELHLFAQPVATKSGVSTRGDNSLLHAAWPAAESYFDVPATEQALSIAAEASTSRTVRRIPASVDVAALYAQYAPAPLPSGDAAGPPQHSYQRTEGSVSSRALGSVVHVYLDKLAQEFAAGASVETLEGALAGWSSGIAAMLRAKGLAPAEIKPRTAQTLAALRGTLADPLGRWLLAPHPQAASERAISAWMGDGALATYRMDRIFRAGDAPLADGEDLLWIVDYKISAHDDDADEAIFAAEAEKHRSQLETYARAQQTALAGAKGIHLAAFYPLRRNGERLKMWRYEPGA